MGATGPDAAADFDAEAARWAVARAHGQWPPEAEAWLAGDPRRRGALLRAEAALAWLESADALAAEAVPTARPAPVSRRAMLGGGAALLAAGLAGGVWLAGRPRALRTEVGETRSTALADGSTVALDTATIALVALAPNARKVRLDAGRALFRVAPDPARPFIVEAGPVRVTVLGTLFAVAVTAHQVSVLVREGRVMVRHPGGSLELTAGMRTQIATGDPAPAVEALAPEEVARALAWREGRLEFAGEPLVQSIAAFNRYNRRPIELADPALGKAPFHGAFRTNDPEGFARAVALSLGTSVRADEERILIGAAPAG